MINYTIKDLCLTSVLRAFQVSDLYDQQNTDLCNITSVDVDDQKLVTSYAVSAYVASQLNNIMQKIIPMVDMSGNFYMTDSETLSDGGYVYRMLSSYIEPETGSAMPMLSQTRYRYDAASKTFIEHTVDKD